MVAITLGLVLANVVLERTDDYEMEDDDSDASTERPTTRRAVTFEDGPVNGAASSKPTSGLGRIRTAVSRQNSRDGGRPDTATTELTQHPNVSSTHIEDLETFPTTSLHSFSFAAQHDTIAARHNIVQRSIDYLRERIIGGQKQSNAREKQEGSNRVAESKTSSTPLTLDLTNVNAHAFDPSRAPLQTAPSSHAFFEGSAHSGDSSQASSGRNSPNFGSRSTTTTSGNSSLATLAMPRNRASSFSEKYPDMRRQLQSSLSCTNLPNLNPYYQTSPLRQNHPTNRWGQQLSQAVFTTSLEEPWNIQSANDYAMMIFGMGRDAIRKKSLVEYVVEDRRDWLRLKLSETRTDKFAEGRVLLCGDVLPVIKRLGTGAASLWIKEKTNGLVWVIEEIEEGVCTLSLDSRDEFITATHGDALKVFEWDITNHKLNDALPTLPRGQDGLLHLEEIRNVANYTLKSAAGDIPCTIEPSIFSTEGKHSIRVSFLPHVAGIIVVSAENLAIKSANPVFTSSLFGLKETTGQHINKLIPTFEKLLESLRGENHGEFTDGQVIPELAFRAAAKNSAGAAADTDLRGIESRHRDGAIVYVDIQLRVSSVAQPTASPSPRSQHFSFAAADHEEQLFALWISYEKGLTPKAQDEVLKTAMFKASKAVAPSRGPSEPSSPICPSEIDEAAVDSAIDQVPRNINEYQILEEMGAGAYGQVKLARYGRKRQRVVVKYVTKSRILVDTWTRDRKLGTVPLEIHVLHYLKSHEHRNLVEMKDFFEDDLNYYVVMAAHTPGMDLFDYIELNTSMSERECKCISLQVAKALGHLHALDIVHRDIKDENVVLDRNGWVKLIDFGSANYCRNGPFDTFHGTLDYASPEALDGKPYMGKEQDVWACGILFYTLIYKENPFYNIDEIMDRDLRVPYVISPESIDLIRRMLNRDVPERFTMQQVIEHVWYGDCIGDPQEKVKIEIPPR